MFREAILEFIRRKDKILKGKYIPGHTPEELWPYDEVISRGVVWRLCTDDDCSFCPWCLVSQDCSECLYGKKYGICSTIRKDNQYAKVCYGLLGGTSITDYLKEHPEDEAFLMEVLDV